MLAQLSDAQRITGRVVSRDLFALLQLMGAIPLTRFANEHSNSDIDANCALIPQNEIIE